MCNFNLGLVGYTICAMALEMHMHFERNVAEYEKFFNIRDREVRD